MKIIDCFMYFDEDLILEIRLNTLNNFVDKFILCEATKDHAGNERELKFNKDYFPNFKDKIEYIVVNDMPSKVESLKKNWHESHFRDQFQRNALQRGIAKYDPDDLIMISDVDEIPNLKDLNVARADNKIIIFEQNIFFVL